MEHDGAGSDEREAARTAAPEDATAALVAELRRRERELATLADTLPDPIARYDRELRVRYVNAAFARSTGYAPEAAVGRTFAELFPPYAADFVPVLERVLAGEGSGEVDLDFATPSGALTFHVRAVPELDDRGAVAGVLVVSRDLTARRRMEERLRQSQRLEALGQLARGVAHEFNNILASVLMYAQSLAESLEPGDPRRADAEEIAAAATRGAAVAKQLLAFGRGQSTELEVLEPGPAPRDAGRIRRALHPASSPHDLPPEGAQPSPDGAGAPPVAGARRRVLVAEDEPPIARVARRILERAGYDVAVEADGRAALERLRRGERFDVVVTDAAMPELSGWQLAEEIARLPSRPPVVLMSGYAEHSAAGRAGAATGRGEPAEFLQKPFTNVELVAVVQRALSRGA